MLARRLMHLRLLLLALRQHHTLLRRHGLVVRMRGVRGMCGMCSMSGVRGVRVLGIGRLLRLGLHGLIMRLVSLVVHVLREVLRRRLGIEAPMLVML